MLLPRTSSLIVVTALAVPTTVCAQATEDTLLHECFTLRGAGRLAEALARCEEAVTRARSGRSLAQLARTEVALERWADAANHLDASLADAAHPWVRQNRAVLEEVMRSVRPRVVELQVSSSSAAVWQVSGCAERAVGSACFVSPGAVTVSVRAADGRATSRTLTLRAGEHVDERIELPAASPVAAVTATQQPPSATQPPTRVAQTPVAPAPGPSGTSTRRVLAWTAAGVALAGFGFGVAAWRVREGIVGDYTASCPAGSSPDPSLVDRCGREHASAEGRVSTWEALTGVGLAVGGALAVTSVVLFVTEPSRPSATAWACAPSIALPGAMCTARF